VTLNCESAPYEVGYIYLFEPGRQFMLGIAYGVSDYEDRFYLDTAIDSLQVAATVP
jgi:hypothetical protein